MTGGKNAPQTQPSLFDRLLPAWLFRPSMQRLRVILAIPAMSLALGAYATALPPQALAPFSTDGCSSFPDRSLITNEDWCHCCVVHDLAYWRGGTAQERATADRQLRTCVANTTGNPPLADLMYAGVRAGGGPYFYTNYRWGYGWPFGRGYAPLSQAERVSVSEQEVLYRMGNPNLTCPPRQIFMQLWNSTLLPIKK